MTYPETAGFVAGCDTSEQAAQSVDSDSLRAIVLRYVVANGSWGCTCEEAEEAFDMRHQTCSARLRELVLRGKIEDSGERRRTRSGRLARVYVAKEA